MQPEFAAIPFQDHAKAEGNLQGVEALLPPTVHRPLASLLKHSPDPDRALNLLERYARAASRDVLDGLGRNPIALSYLVAVFGYSAFLAESFLAEPSLPLQFARDRKFTKLKSKEELLQDYARFATTHPDPWLASQLAHFKRRNYLRIVLKDVLGLSTLGETTLELSLLADVILHNVLAFCDQEFEKRYGQPQYRDAHGRIVRSGFGIVSLGKLGGNELNYSSDVDLLFLYERDGETAGGNERDSLISNKEYFVRLAHAITRTITQPTPHGQVFRVDLRLRPEGQMGDLAISVKSALEYYEHRARDWELQMLIKARHSAGDPHVTREFLNAVESYVYAAPGDFEAVKSVLHSRERISRNLRERGGAEIDVKRHPGGIRDVEFLVQCLQRLHGGRDAWVRSGGTLRALRKLNDKGWLSDRDYATLVNAYELFRRVEHRIQFELGRQTHRLPANVEALDQLARRCGLESPTSPGQALVSRLERVFGQVEEIYQRVIHPAATAAEAPYYLKSVTVPSPDHGLYSYNLLLSYLDAQAPELGELIRQSAIPERARKGVTRLFSALLASPEKFRAARRMPEALARALQLTGESEYLGDLLTHHPEDIETLDLPAEAGEPTEQMSLVNDLPSSAEPFAWATERGLDPREKVAILRRHFRQRVLTLAAADLSEMPSVFGALARWSQLAARSVASALWISHQTLALNGSLGVVSAENSPLVILGLGRLGLNEFDLASDADLIFVVPSSRSGDDVTTLIRVAEKTLETLSSYTRDGTVFAVDTRLRPRGQEGELLVSEDALLDYVAHHAQVWEALAYLKVRPVAGDFNLGKHVTERLALGVLERFQGDPTLEGKLQEMRRRLEREMSARHPNTKTAPGGYYDIDFAISFLRLRHGVQAPLGANTSQQVSILERQGLISREDASTLREGAAFLRALDHAFRLVLGRTAEGLPESSGLRAAVENLPARWGQVKSPENLEKRWHEVEQGIRYVYRRIVGSE